MTGCTKPCALFEGKLEYCTPTPERADTSLDKGLPESFVLHVAPPACGRRLAISASMRHLRGRRAHLYISEEDIVSACYEDMIPEAVQRILGEVGPTPKAIIIEVTCVDDLLGTDHEALLALLKERFAGTHFCVRRIDPIRRTSALPPPVSRLCSLFSMLDRSDETEDSVNLLTGMTPVAEQSEIFRILAQMGFRVRQMDTCETFQDFLDMAKSRFNIVTAPMALMAAQDMEKKLGIPYLYLPATVEIEKIDMAYEQIAEKSERALPDLSRERKAAMEELERALREIGDTPVAIDPTGDQLPLTLARYLIGRGVRVKLVLENMLFDGDKSDYHWLREQHPEVSILQSGGVELLNRAEEFQDCLCLGFTCGYLLRAKHVVCEEGGKSAYGYQMTATFARNVQTALQTEFDFEKVKRQSEGGGKG
ncbi:MAG: nitrogenase component 1 [Lachnospiraceae bacterium]|nr:nitrogenase component 1 [Lachnospiraceae bacterium]